MGGRSTSSAENDLVKVAYANDEPEAELIQGLLRTAGVNSVLRRAPGFDVPEFLSAGPREVLVAAYDVPAARDVLREVDSGEPKVESDEPEPTSRPGRDRRSRVLAALLIPVAIVVLVVCLATDVIV